MKYAAAGLVLLFVAEPEQPNEAEKGIRDFAIESDGGVFIGCSASSPSIYLGPVVIPPHGPFRSACLTRHSLRVRGHNSILPLLPVKFRRGESEVRPDVDINYKIIELLATQATRGRRQIVGTASYGEPVGIEARRAMALANLLARTASISLSEFEIVGLPTWARVHWAPFPWDTARPARPGGGLAYFLDEGESLFASCSYVGGTGSQFFERVAEEVRRASPVLPDERGFGIGLYQVVFTINGRTQSVWEGSSKRANAGGALRYLLDAYLSVECPEIPQDPRRDAVPRRGASHR